MNKTKLFGITAMVAVIGFSMTALSLTGCDDGSGGGDGGGGGAGPLVAKWYATQAAADAGGSDWLFEFRSNGTFVISSNTTAEFTYTIAGGKVTLAMAGANQGEANYAVTGSELALSNGTIILQSLAMMGPYYKKGGGSGNPSNPASGTVSIQDSIYGDYYLVSGGRLTAVFDGVGVITYAWYKKATSGMDTLIIKDRECTFSSFADGDQVYVIANDTDGRLVATSETIMVKAAPAYVEFLGKWILKELYDLGSGSASNKEYLDIAPGYFKLDSDWAGGAPGNYTPPKGDIFAIHEYIYFDIFSWTELGNNASPAIPAGFNTAYQLAVTVKAKDANTNANKGYTEYTSFRLYGKTEGDPIVTLNRAATNTLIPREYRRPTAAEMSNWPAQIFSF